MGFRLLVNSRFLLSFIPESKAYIGISENRYIIQVQVIAQLCTLSVPRGCQNVVFKA
jgi:hypothetical protein